MLNALQPLSDLLFGGMYPSLRQQTAQAHILHFKTEVVFRSHVLVAFLSDSIGRSISQVAPSFAAPPAMTPRFE